jgi:hypothetical protein
MKKTIILLILVLVLSGCVGVEKEKVIKSSDNSTITFYPDNHFIVYYTSDNTSWAGTYQIHGDIYEITFAAMGIVQTFKSNETAFVLQTGKDKGEIWTIQ